MTKPRARDLGIPFTGTPGPHNAITDVLGVHVGHTTLISGPSVEAEPACARTGVTVILPRGRESEPVFGAWHTLNGCGEMTGTTWLEESGQLAGPVALTNTANVGTVGDAVVDWWYARPRPVFVLPVVGETYDGFLNDIRGRHVRRDHVLAALDGAAPGPVAEGNVGGGTGMVCHDFKGGIGTSSRVVDAAGQSYTVGVLVQANHGSRHTLTIAGVPVGRHLSDVIPGNVPGGSEGGSSILVVVATDCPLLPHQLKRLARRVPLGIARVGGIGENGSGDIFLAFSTAPQEPAAGSKHLLAVRMLDNDQMNPLFEGTVFATEEAIVNALVAAETMAGVEGHIVYAMPLEPLVELLRASGRLQ